MHTNTSHDLVACSAAPSLRNKNTRAAAPLNKDIQAPAPGRIEAWLGQSLQQDKEIEGKGTQGTGAGSVQEWFLEETEKLRLDVSLREGASIDNGGGVSGGDGDGDASRSFDSEVLDGGGTARVGHDNDMGMPLITSPEKFIRNTLLLRAEARCC